MTADTKSRRAPAGGEDRVCLGAITGAYGVRGEVRVKSFCAEPTAIADYGPLASEDGSRSFALTLSRPVKGGFAARLSGVASKEDADALKGTRLYVDRARLPDLPEDEFYHSDLIGLRAFDPGGALLGRIRAVQDFGAGDILEIAPEAGGETLLIPFTRDHVPTVDLAAGRVVVDPPQMSGAPEDG